MEHAPVSLERDKDRGKYIEESWQGKIQKHSNFNVEQCALRR